MKYYSGTGDAGETQIAKKRVKKNAPIIKAVGDVDELNAFLGHAYSLAKDENVRKTIKTIEKTLYVIGSQLSGYIGITKSKIKPISDGDVSDLERLVESYSSQLKDMTRFVYPNGTETATYLNMCRSIARRTERSIIDAGIKDEPLLRYINRLSSLLFVMFRHVNKEEGYEEEFF